MNPIYLVIILGARFGTHELRVPMPSMQACIEAGNHVYVDLRTAGNPQPHDVFINCEGPGGAWFREIK